MITIQDFAKQMGVTDRSIQRHLKKHEAALTGHFERRKGKNGTLLDDYACDYIREHITEKTVIAESPQTKALFDLMSENSKLKEYIAELEKNNLQIEHSKALLEAHKLQIEEKSAEKDKLIDELQANNNTQTVIIAELRAESSLMSKNLEDEKQAKFDALERSRELSEQLDVEKHRKLTLKERILGIKQG